MIPINPTPERTLLGWLVRHGELKNMRVWDGWGAFDLSEQGRESAEKAAQWLSFEKIGRIISSDVPRTITTAQIIMDACDVQCPFLYTDPNLRPWNVAKFTGQEKTPERIKEFEYYLNHPDEVIPEGESKNQLKERIQVIAQYLCSPYDAKPTVIACHNSVIKAFLDLDQIKEAVDYGGIVACYMNEKGDLDFEVVLGAVTPEVGVS